MQLITSDGIKISYDDLGDGLPVVILTGIGGSRKIWADQVPVLLENGYRVILMDARNQGESQHTIHGRRIARHAADLHELIQKLGLETAILMGNSMGAATMFAYLDLYAEIEIRAVVDVDQSPKMINDADWAYGFRELTWQNVAEWSRQPLTHATKQRLSDSVYAGVQHVEQTNPYDAEINQPLLLDHATQDWRDVILQMQMPFLIVAGGASPYFNPAFAEVAARLAQHGQAQIIPGCGHIVMAEQPIQFNQVMLKFFTDVKKGVVNN